MLCTIATILTLPVSPMCSRIMRELLAARKPAAKTAGSVWNPSMAETDVRRSLVDTLNFTRLVLGHGFKRPIPAPSAGRKYTKVTSRMTGKLAQHHEEADWDCIEISTPSWRINWSLGLHQIDLCLYKALPKQHLYHHIQVNLSLFHAMCKTSSTAHQVPTKCLLDTTKKWPSSFPARQAKSPVDPPLLSSFKKMIILTVLSGDEALMIDGILKMESLTLSTANLRSGKNSMSPVPLDIKNVLWRRISTETI